MDHERLNQGRRTFVHIGTATGYYTAIMACLVGPCRPVGQGDRDRA
jgi:protein-L-isoaspartate O-methyltransferase